MTLLDFVQESNLIEGIDGKPTKIEISAHEEFLDLPEVRVPELKAFVRDVAGAELRDHLGMNVRVGPHLPPPGGPEIADDLADLLSAIADYELPAFETHVSYEKLHPFMDGNGRSGRVLWAWQMRHEGHDPFALPFLHRFYYQSLEGSRS